MTIIIQSRPSNGAFVLAQSLREAGARVLRRRRDSTTRLHPSSFLVNWGCGRGSQDPHLNDCRNVRDAIHKAACFEMLEFGDVNIPVWTVEAAREGQENADDTIWLARSATDHGGRGITVVRPGDTFPCADLYVQYIPKRIEFRVHVFRILNGNYNVLSRQKLRPNGADMDRDERLIRNATNGWVFGLVRDEEAARKAEAEAIKALDALGLDFGAADVIIGRDDGLPYVLEMNTAPGLEAEPVIEFYRDNILGSYKQWRESIDQ